MRGLRATIAVEEARAAGGEQGSGPNELMMSLLDDEGLTSVVATNCEQHYGRPLVVGDRLLVRSVIESISDPKRTGLGTGRFITTRMDYVAVPDADVPEASPCPPSRSRRSSTPASRWRPSASGSSSTCRPTGRRRARRGRVPPSRRTTPSGSRAPGSTQLLIQHCTSCGTLRHPPLPACGTCGSLEWDAVEASGRGTLYSYVVVHYPQVAAFEYPLPIGLVELEEGTRVVANLGGVEPGRHRDRHGAASPSSSTSTTSCRCPSSCRPARRVREGGLMDFNFSEEQLAVSEAATGVFSGLVDPERVGAVEQTDDRIDRALWQALADADLLGLAVPESEGGAGQGLMELCLLLEAQGNAVAPVPLWATLVLGALPIAHFGSEAQRARWLPGVVSGDVILTAALTEQRGQPDVVPGRAGHGTGRRVGARWHRAGGAPGAPGGPHRRAGAHRRWRRGARARRPRAPGVSLERARDHQSRNPSAPAPRRGDRRRRGRPGRRRLRSLDARLRVGGGHHRAVRAPGRRVRGGAHADRGVPERAPPVRAPAEHVPGHHAAGGGRRHRHRGHAGHVAERRLALRHRPRRRRRRPGGQVAGRRAGAADRARHPAPPRRHGRGHHVPDPPLLPVGQADRAAPGRPERAARPARRGHRRAGPGARRRRGRSGDGRRRRGRPSSTSRWATSCRRSSCP